MRLARDTGDAVAHVRTLVLILHASSPPARPIAAVLRLTQRQGGFAHEGWPDRDDRRRLVACARWVRDTDRRREAVVGHATQRDDDGFFRTGDVRLASPTYAITSDRIDLDSEPGPADWLIDREALGTVKLELDPVRPEEPVFAKDQADQRRRGVPRRCEP